jgi:hypothetical protein
MANTIGWGQGVLNTIGWGADGSSGGLETTNLLAENSDFFVTEAEDFLIDETLINSGGFGAVYDVSYSSETLLER